MTVKCEVCGRPLRVAKNTFKNDAAQKYSELTLVCCNFKCGNYAGEDLGNPKKIAAIQVNKVD